MYPLADDTQTIGYWDDTVCVNTSQTIITYKQYDNRSGLRVKIDLFVVSK